MGSRRIHELRHSTATLLLEGGVDLGIISGVLGHASFQITQQLYTEIREKSLDVAAVAMEKKYGVAARR